MLIDQSLALGPVEAEDGSVVIRGWIKAPVSSKVMIRFETFGTETDQVEGLYWASIGGWYRYLPATGKPEYFELNTSFDLETHGVPLLWVERWSGEGEIDVVIDGYTGPHKLLFWSNSFGQEKLRSTFGVPTECFGLDSGLITAGAVRSTFANQKLSRVRNKILKKEVPVADITKTTLKRLDEASYDALVVDIESMLRPIACVEDSYIEDSTDARALGVIPLGARVLTPNDSQYWDVLLQSFESVVVASRPRPVIALVPNSTADASCEANRLPPGVQDEAFDEQNLPWDEFANQLLTLGVEIVRIDSEKRLSAMGRTRIREILREGKIVDSRMKKLPLALPETTLASSCEIRVGEPQILDGLRLAEDFFVEADILVPSSFPVRNLILVLKLEIPTEDFDSTALRASEIYRSSLLGVEYFKYIETIEGYRHYQIPVTLPKSVTCSGIGFAQVRSEQKVGVRNLAVRAERSLRQEVKQ